MKSISPHFKKENIPIVFISDENYVKYLSVTIASIAQNASSQKKYDIIVFGENLSAKSEEKLYALVSSFEKISLRIFDTADFLQEVDTSLFILKRKNMSSAAYFRLFLPEILTAYKKCIYLDCDLVVNADLEELFATTLERNLLAVVKDQGMGNSSPEDKEIRDYLIGFLKLNSYQDYFNSGVLVLNLVQMRTEQFSKKALLVLKDEEFGKVPFHDQTIFNLLAKNRVKYLDYKYNIQWVFSENDKIPFTDEMNFATKNPSIIHYITDKKPWNYRLNHLADYFWKYAQYSPYYEEILCAYKKAFFEENLRNKKLYKKYRIRTLFSFGLFPRWKRKMKLYAERIDHLCF